MESMKHLPCTIVDLVDSTRGAAWSDYYNSYFLLSIKHYVIQITGDPTKKRELERYAGLIGTSGANNGQRLTEATFNFTNYTGICTNSQGAIVMSEGDSHMIRMIEGDTVSLFAGTGTKGMKDGPRLEATFYLPYSVAYSESTSTWFIGDFGNHSIRAIQHGRVYTIAGGQKQSSLQDNTPLFATRFNGPIALSMAPDDSFLLISDLFNGTVRKMDLLNEFVHTVVGKKTTQEFRNCRANILLPDGSIYITGEPKDKTTKPDHINPFITSTASLGSSESKSEPSTSLAPSANSVPALPSPPTEVLPPELLKPNETCLAEDLEHQELACFADTSSASSIHLRKEWGDSHIWLMLSTRHKEIASAATSGLQRHLLLYDASGLPVWNPGPPPRPPSIDLSPLLEPSAPSHLSDISITNQHHNKTFSLHSLVLKAQDINIDLLKEVLEKSVSPADALDFFVASLYRDMSNWIPALAPSLEVAIQLSETIILFSLVKANCWQLFGALKIRILPLLSPDDLCSLLHYVWTKLEKYEPIVSACVGHLVEHVPVFTSKAPAWEFDPDGFTILLTRLIGGPAISTLTSIDQFAPFWLSVPNLTRGLRRCADDLAWKDSSSIRSPGCVRFVLPEISEVLDIPEVLLYGAWPYYRRMMASGLSESQSGILELPVGFPRELLFSIAQCLHGSGKAHLRGLSSDSFEFIRSRGAEFELVEIESDTGSARPPFGQLVHRCRITQ